VEEQL